MPIHRHDAHVCLVSEQATPNFLPVLDSRFKPREVILVISSQMRERASWLKRAIERRGTAVTELLIDDAWDVPGLQNALLELVAAREGMDVALNVTGGTKPMAIAAQEVFRAAKLPIFYVHPAKNQVVPLFAGEQPFAIEERVGLADFLAIHGFDEVSRDQREYPEAYAAYAEEFVKEVGRFGKPLRTLNALANSAASSLRVALGHHDKDPHLGELLDKLLLHGLAHKEKNTLIFPNEIARFFVNGGWLELHIARVVAGHAQQLGVQDHAHNLVIKSAKNARNEIDVAFLAHNRLYLVECKTKRFQMGGTAGSSVDGPGAESLYKLDSLTALGGLNTRGALISYQPLEQWDRRRAEDLRIRIVESDQLRNLAKHLREWVNAP